MELIKESTFHLLMMVLHIDDSKDSTRNFLKLIKTFSKVARYNTKIQKSVALLCTNDKLLRNKSEKLTHLQYLKKISCS